MVRHTIKCSQCDETFPDGFEYRMHWEKHFDEFLNKQKMNTNTGNLVDHTWICQCGAMNAAYITVCGNCNEDK